jgi:hypothetical protein
MLTVFMSPIVDQATAVPPPGDRRALSGRSGTRTPDFLRVKQAL